MRKALFDFWELNGEIFFNKKCTFLGEANRIGKLKLSSRPDQAKHNASSHYRRGIIMSDKLYLFYSNFSEPSTTGTSNLG